MPIELSFIQLVLKPVTILIYTLVVCACAAEAKYCSQHDQEALLYFSANLSISSSHAPLNWSFAVDCCLWEGITCNEGGRVKHLGLPFRGLSGLLSPSLANLSHLSQLNLSHNRLCGVIPFQFTSLLNQLQILDLSFNRFSGELPSLHNSISNIEVVDLSSNSFNGTLPPSLLQHAAERGTLTAVNVSNNSITGQIPISSVCSPGNNSSSLRFLDLSYNKFNGTIPSGLRRCSKLQVFRAGSNSLYGPIPSDIFGAVSLQELSLSINILNGTIEDGILGLKNLTVLELHSNFLSGPIPQDIGKLSKLEQLLLHLNNLTGVLPPSLMHCTHLVTLNLRFNSLVGDLSNFNFSTLTQLMTLDLAANKFTGNLPQTLYACSSLTALRLAGNKLEGQISPDILKLQSLSFLSLSANNLTNFTGAISILKELKNLNSLVLSKNFFWETIIDDENTIGSDDFQKLQILGLSSCNFAGQVPSWLQKLQKLKLLDLSYNQLTSSIPGWLASLPKLFYIDLSHNQLTGEFPKELTRLTALTSQRANDKVEDLNLEIPIFVGANNVILNQQEYNQLRSLPPAIYLRNNHLQGTIPTDISQLKSLHVLDLSQNNISGNIPDHISDMTNLERLDLSDNQLSGHIPASLGVLHFLSYFSVANNSLEGEIPTGGQLDTFPYTSFEGNPQLCGTAVQRSCFDQQADKTSHIHHSHTRKIVVAVIIAASFTFASIAIILACFLVSKSRVTVQVEPDNIANESLSRDQSVMMPVQVDIDNNEAELLPYGQFEHLPRTSYKQILQATGGFSPSNLIGSGYFGSVYRGTLHQKEREVAIKLFNVQKKETSKSFILECNALRSVRHRNLVKILTCCSSLDNNGNEFKAIVFDYMVNGNLDQWLHHPQTEMRREPKRLNFLQRVNIAFDVATALHYLHHQCGQQMVHCDLKPSNVLLDADMVAHVSDFGLARLLYATSDALINQISSIGIKGSFGYIAPEYGMGGKASTSGDVYSFGIVMLEMFTGKRPTDDIFNDALTLNKYAKSALPDKLVQIVDPTLLEFHANGYDCGTCLRDAFQRCLVDIFKLAVACSEESAKARMTMKDVIKKLCLVKETLSSIQL